MAKKKKRSRSTGWAHTKKYPHERHPAHYRKKGNDDIEYLTFTHSEEVDLPNGKKVTTVPLQNSITPSERGTRRSYVFPKVYEGKRSALGKETSEYSIAPEDKTTVHTLFKTLPREKVPVTGGSSQYRKRKKKKPRK